MTLFITVVHVLVCIILIVVVLLQRGKGAEIGAVFGGGASNTVFGSRGAGNFFTRLTTGAAAVFMVTSLVLSYMATQQSQPGLFDDEEPAAAEEPAGDAADSPFGEIPGAATPGEIPGAADSPFGEVPGAATPGETPAQAAPPSEPAEPETAPPAEAPAP